MNRKSWISKAKELLIVLLRFQGGRDFLVSLIVLNMAAIGAAAHAAGLQAIAVGSFGEFSGWPGAEAYHIEGVRLPSISAAGDVVFRGFKRPFADLNTQFHSVWAWSPGAGLRELASTSPGFTDPVTGRAYVDFVNAQIQRDGDATVVARVAGDDLNSFNDHALLEFRNGATHQIARAGELFPGQEPGTTIGFLTNVFDYFNLPWGYPADQTIYSGAARAVQLVDGGGNLLPRYAIIAGAPGGDGYRTVAITEPMPDAPSQTLSELGTRGGIAENSAGQVSFLAALNETSTGIFVGQSLWSEIGGNGLRRVVSMGAPVPGLAAGVTLGGMTDMAAGENGDFAVVSWLAGSWTGSATDESLWSVARDGSLQLLALGGNAAPGLPDGVTFAPRLYPSLSPALGDDGEFAFLAELAGQNVDDSNNNAIWKFSPTGGTSVVARLGEPAPGSVDGEPLGRFASFSTPIVNAAGQVAFTATAKDENDVVRTGIWAQDRSGQLQKIVSDGDLVDIDPGPGESWEPIGSISWFPAGAGERAVSFNERGEIVFRASVTHFTYSLFTDAGIFYSDAAAVPEPEAAFFATLLAIWLLAWRLRQSRLSVG